MRPPIDDAIALAVEGLITGEMPEDPELRNLGLQILGIRRREAQLAVSRL